MGSVIRIVVAEGDPELSELFRERFSAVPDFEVVGAAPSGRAAIAVVTRLNPDIVTMDIDLPGIGGLEILPVVRWCNPKTKVVVLSDHDEEATILEALELGAKGYIVKGDGTDMIKAIRAIQNGEIWVGRRVLARMLERLIGLATGAFGEAEGEPAHGMSRVYANPFS